MRPIDPAAQRFGEVLRALTTLVSIFERRLALAGLVSTEPSLANPYDSPLGVKRLVAYLESTASIQVKPPAHRSDQEETLSLCR